MNKIQVSAYAGAGAEIASFLCWAAGGPLAIVLSLHLFALGFFCLALYERRRAQRVRDYRNAVYLFDVFLIAFFPYIGLLGALVMEALLRYYRSRLHRGLYEDYEAYISEKAQDPLERHEHGSLWASLREDISFEPLVDIIKGKDVAMKAKAIQKLAKSLTAQSVNVLRSAIRDPSPEVRLFAAGALIKMEAGLEDQIQTLLRETKKGPTARTFSDLGDLYATSVEIGFVESRFRDQYLNLSAESYQRSLHMDADQLQVVIRFCRCLLRLGEFEEARELVDDAEKRWPVNHEIMFLRNEVHFRLRRFDEIEEKFAALDLRELDNVQKSVAAFWTEKK